MRLDLYKQGAAGTPLYFDILMNKNGTLLVINPRSLAKEKLTVVLENGPQHTPTSSQMVAIYAMLSRYRWTEVTTWNLDV
jgi:hypothetical protein